MRTADEEACECPPKPPARRWFFPFVRALAIFILLLAAATFFALPFGLGQTGLVRLPYVCPQGGRAEMLALPDRVPPEFMRPQERSVLDFYRSKSTQLRTRLAAQSHIVTFGERVAPGSPLADGPGWALPPELVWKDGRVVAKPDPAALTRSSTVGVSPALPPSSP